MNWGIHIMGKVATPRTGQGCPQAQFPVVRHQLHWRARSCHRPGGLAPPTELDAVPRTIFDNDRSRHFYDQIACFSEPDGTSMLEGLICGQRASSFHFIPHVYRELTLDEVFWRISDHYPLWCEFLLD